MLEKPASPERPSYPELAQAGSGIGLRAIHHDDIITQPPDVGFLEAHSENYFSIGGIPFDCLMKCRENYPVSLHGVGLSLGSADGVKDAHLRKLKTLVDIAQPALVSEHISWSSLGSVSAPDLLPLPMTQESLNIICCNISKAQDVLRRSILAENPSRYLSFKYMDMDEPEFLIEIAKRTGCGILLDINNLHVCSHNTGFDPVEYLNNIPRGIVGEIHLAGYQVNTVEGKDILIDAHNNPVSDSVWTLYEAAIARLGNIATLIEWDSNIPPLDRLVGEAAKADHIRNKHRHAANAA